MTCSQYGQYWELKFFFLHEHVYVACPHSLHSVLFVVHEELGHPGLGLVLPLGEEQPEGQYGLVPDIVL